MLSRRLGSRAFHQPETDGPTSVEDIYVYSTAVPQGTASADDPSSPGPAFHHPRRHTVDVNTKHTRKGPAEPTRATLRRARPGPGLEEADPRVRRPPGAGPVYLMRVNLRQHVVQGGYLWRARRREACSCSRRSVSSEYYPEGRRPLARRLPCPSAVASLAVSWVGR